MRTTKVQSPKRASYSKPVKSFGLKGLREIQQSRNAEAEDYGGRENPLLRENQLDFATIDPGDDLSEIKNDNMEDGNYLSEEALNCSFVLDDTPSQKNNTNDKLKLQLNRNQEVGKLISNNILDELEDLVNKVDHQEPHSQRRNNMVREESQKPFRPLIPKERAFTRLRIHVKTNPEILQLHKTISPKGPYNNKLDDFLKLPSGMTRSISQGGDILRELSEAKPKHPEYKQEKNDNYRRPSPRGYDTVSSSKQTPMRKEEFFKPRSTALVEKIRSPRIEDIGLYYLVSPKNMGMERSESSQFLSPYRMARYKANKSRNSSKEIVRKSVKDLEVDMSRDYPRPISVKPRKTYQRSIIVTTKHLDDAQEYLLRGPRNLDSKRFFSRENERV